MVGVVETVKEALFLVWACLYIQGGCGPTCNDQVVIRYLSCVGRSSILIVIPLSLVVCMSYNNRPGAA